MGRPSEVFRFIFVRDILCAFGGCVCVLLAIESRSLYVLRGFIHCLELMDLALPPSSAGDDGSVLP